MKRRVLAVGVATQDVVLHLDAFPREDSEMRARSHELRLGGNAANSLNLLRQWDHRCDWAGSLAADARGQWIQAALNRRGIGTSQARIHGRGCSPISHILLNLHTGSRTIIHDRELPEFNVEDFQRIEVGRYAWVHLEGRNPLATQRMLERLHRHAIPCSVEIEKDRPEIQSLYEAPVLLFSRAYAESLGYDHLHEFLSAVGPRTQARLCWCAWGSGGAGVWMRDTGMIIDSPVIRPPAVLDTLGAGDVFNGAVIHGLLQERPVSDILHEACRIAGKKCGQSGIDDVLSGDQRGEIGER